jgi:Fic family protein
MARANRLIGELPPYGSSDPLDKIVSYLFIRREAVQSSRIEGTWSTIDHILTPAELFDRKGGKSERASVLGYAHALEAEFSRILKKRAAAFSVRLAQRLHREVMRRDPQFKGQPGRLRTPGTPGSVVLIGGLGRREESVFNPAPPRHVGRCLEDVMSWMGDRELIELGDAGMGMSLPVRMAIGHAHFEAVHPFSDGNGRVGRMLLTLQMACRGILPLYLSGFIEAERSQYGKALGEAQKKLRYAAIIEFLCEALVATHREARETKAAIRRLPGNWEKRGAFREKSAGHRSLSWLMIHPIFTVKTLKEALKVSWPAAGRAVTQLEEAKIVRERTGFGRNRVFAAEEVIELLSRRFGDDPDLGLERARNILRSPVS